MASFKDEMKAVKWGWNLFLAYIVTPIIVALVVIPLHEAMHYIGSVIEGGTITDATFLNFTAFLKTFYFFIPSEEPLGRVVVEGATGFAGLPQGTIFYGLPYAVGFGVGFLLLLGDNIDLPNWTRLFGAPLIYYNLLSLPNELSLYYGSEVFTLNPFLMNGIYIAIVLGGVGATTIDSYLLNDKVI